MRIQGHLRDNPLPELLSMLSNRQESGCLRIEFEPEPAFFYFKNGQLVDARMSFLKGFAAVHLAFSRAKAAFDFDNAVEPPQSAITDENERLLLSGMLGVKLSGEVEVATSPRPVAVEEVSKASRADLNSNNPTESQPVLEQAPNVVMPIVVVPPLAAQTSEPAVWPEITVPTRRPRANPIRFALRWRPSFGYLPRQKLLRTAAVILVIAVPATVGITVRFGKKDSAVPVAAAASQPAFEPQVSPSQTETTKVADHSIVPAPTVANLATHPRPIVKETPYEQPKPVKETPREITKETSRPPEPEATAIADQVSKTIVVQIRVEEGRVTEAWVKNSNKALAAYEATAIRLARQRRYSADTTRTESVSVDVSVKK